jgi:hypothetical protein
MTKNIKLSAEVLSMTQTAMTEINQKSLQHVTLYSIREECRKNISEETSLGRIPQNTV